MQGLGGNQTENACGNSVGNEFDERARDLPLSARAEAVSEHKGADESQPNQQFLDKQGQRRRNRDNNLPEDLKPEGLPQHDGEIHPQIDQILQMKSHVSGQHEREES